MRITELTDAELLERLSTAAAATNTHLTAATRLFYVRLVHLCELDGKHDNKGCYFEFTVKEFAAAMNISVRSATYSLARLSSCGAILRDSSTTAIFVPSKTYLVDSFLH